MLLTFPNIVLFIYNIYPVEFNVHKRGLIRNLSSLNGFRHRCRIGEHFTKTCSVQFPFIKHSPVVESILVLGRVGGRERMVKPSLADRALCAHRRKWGNLGVVPRSSHCTPVSFRVIDTERKYPMELLYTRLRCSADDSFVSLLLFFMKFNLCKCRPGPNLFNFHALFWTLFSAREMFFLEEDYHFILYRKYYSFPCACATKDTPYKFIAWDSHT